MIGTGISGLVVAHRLAGKHDLTVFEAGDRVGGHTHTHDFTVRASDGRESTHAVDSGFIVFNERTYPNFVALLAELGVSFRDSDMSFSVRDDRDGLEYNGTNLSGLFSQRRNLFRPRFWGMLRDLLRFYRGSAAYLAPDQAGRTLGEVLAEGSSVARSSSSIFCRWAPRSGLRAPTTCRTFRRRPSRASSTTTGSCN